MATSLLDALLLEPPRLDLSQPKAEIWMALRTDGQKGSGTQSDPINGRTRLGSILSVVSITREYKGTRVEATASTGTVEHGYQAGNLVTVAGATGQGAGYYNGTFRLHATTATAFQR